MSLDLIAGIKARPSDQQRWTAWYNMIYPMLIASAYRRCSGDGETARDLVQEGLERFVRYRGIERVEDERSALVYLLQTCRRIAYDWYNSSQSCEEFLEDLTHFAQEEGIAESVSDLNALIRFLREEDQDLIRMAREGYTLNEIAETLGITSTAAGVRLHRIKVRLRELARDNVKSPGKWS